MNSCASTLLPTAPPKPVWWQQELSLMLEEEKKVMSAGNVVLPKTPAMTAGFVNAKQNLRSTEVLGFSLLNSGGAPLLRTCNLAERKQSSTSTECVCFK